MGGGTTAAAGTAATGTGIGAPVGVPVAVAGGTVAVASTAALVLGVVNVIGAANTLQMANQAGHNGGSSSTPDTKEAAEKGAGAADNVFHVTPDGVVLPKGSKHKIPEGYVVNPHRPGSYGEIVNGKFKEQLRIDPPTPPGQKGPNTSHYHLDGKGKHYSPAPGDKDPGFQP